MSIEPTSRDVRDVRVWDVAVRGFHWSLVASVALSTLALWWWVGAHRPAGYVAAALVLLRIVWGFTGSRHARFAQFLRPPSITARYAGRVFARREPRYIGHNPLGGWMSVALGLCVVALAVSGWLYTTDWFWGEEWVERLHSALAWSLLVLVSLHLIGVIFTSLRHRENLVRAMLDGRKRAPSKDDVD